MESQNAPPSCSNSKWPPYTFFFISDPFLTLAQKIGEAFLKNCPKKWFSNCLVDGLLNSIV